MTEAGRGEVGESYEYIARPEGLARVAEALGRCRVIGLDTEGDSTLSWVRSERRSMRIVDPPRGGVVGFATSK